MYARHFKSNFIVTSHIDYLATQLSLSKHLVVKPFKIKIHKKARYTYLPGVKVIFLISLE